MKARAEKDFLNVIVTEVLETGDKGCLDHTGEILSGFYTFSVRDFDAHLIWTAVAYPDKMPSKFEEIHHN